MAKKKKDELLCEKCGKSIIPGIPFYIGDKAYHFSHWEETLKEMEKEKKDES